MSRELTRIIKLSEITEDEIDISIDTLLGNEDDLIYEDEEDVSNIETSEDKIEENEVV